MSQLGTVDEFGNPRLDVRVRGPRGDVLNVSMVVDTGFSGAMVLRRTQIELLGLELRDEAVVTLADGTEKSVNTYGADIEWFGKWRHHMVLELGGEPLFGMILMRGRHVTIEAVEGGTVRIDSIDTSK